MGELMGAHAGTHISRNEGTRKVSGERHISKKTLAASPSSDKSHRVEAFGVKISRDTITHLVSHFVLGLGTLKINLEPTLQVAMREQEGNRRWGGGRRVWSR